ncbi:MULTISPECIES: hypothetical protein [Halomicrobium]|uniref:Uncharacterized protein n=2 Tax=Halomicrobium mukohataei TaxID=57705 RepID=C7NVT1_HALMD|nr:MULTISPECIES: hypothetical protein [Halomicrobium]ACV46196.1 hypothetical protein Hmuk_0045 [Halomicrobium mukohataei DSM 12286]MBO4247069.1 hypothetical protein [Halomicrobium sp. IBSBa]NLV11564.1 hypothetical protein [Halomicrobium mukohataei]QCD64762.1 hypothetical protein E5139_03545 [Halomicrobium mukohataei]QFR19569.1 hypothetical protein GBQ70_03545 [Halomicrobium sp. ZPS1]
MTIVLRGFFVSSAVLLALLGLATPTIEPGTGTFVISVLSGAMLGAVFLGSAACIYADWDPFEELLG